MKRIQFYLMLGLINVLTIPMAQRLGRLLFALGVRRNVTLGNLRIAFPLLTEKERIAIAKKCYSFFGGLLVEASQFHRWPDAKIREHIQVEGREHADRALARGQGIVVAGAHLGWFDIAGVISAMDGYPITTVYQKVRNPYVDRYITRIRERGGMRMVQRGMGFREIYSALERKEVVAMLADQDAGPNGLFLPFFSQYASTLRGAAEFALRTNSALLTCNVICENGRVIMRVMPEIPRGTINEMMMEYTRRLEAAIRQHPEQYFWLHKRWKTRPRFLIASENPGKIKEIDAIFQHFGLPTKSAGKISYPPEADDYQANAFAKAHAAATQTGLPAIADDSGIEVDALDGRPGVHSARYAKTSTEQITKLLGELENRKQRTARFRAVAVCVFPDGKTLSSEETWEGEIALAPKGDGGFGYDPIFFDPVVGKGAAEMSAEEKRERSHRGKAFRKLAEMISASS